MARSAFPLFGIEGAQPVSGRKPHLLAVVGDSIHPVGAGKGTVFAENFSGCSFHACILIARQRGGE